MSNMIKAAPVPVTERDFESLSRLAEDVMQVLYMCYDDFDAEGNEIFTKCYKRWDKADEETWEREIHPAIREEQIKLMDLPERIVFTQGIYSARECEKD